METSELEPGTEGAQKRRCELAQGMSALPMLGTPALLSLNCSEARTQE